MIFSRTTFLAVAAALLVKISVAAPVPVPAVVTGKNVALQLRDMDTYLDVIAARAGDIYLAEMLLPRDMNGRKVDAQTTAKAHMDVGKSNRLIATGWGRQAVLHGDEYAHGKMEEHFDEAAERNREAKALLAHPDRMTAVDLWASHDRVMSSKIKVMDSEAEALRRGSARPPSHHRR